MKQNAWKLSSKNKIKAHNSLTVFFLFFKNIKIIIKSIHKYLFKEKNKLETDADVKWGIYEITLNHFLTEFYSEKIAVKNMRNCEKDSCKSAGSCKVVDLRHN